MPSLARCSKIISIAFYTTLTRLLSRGTERLLPQMDAQEGPYEAPVRVAYRAHQGDSLRHHKS